MDIWKFVCAAFLSSNLISQSFITVAQMEQA